MRRLLLLVVLAVAGCSSGTSTAPTGAPTGLPAQQTVTASPPPSSRASASSTSYASTASLATALGCAGYVRDAASAPSTDEAGCTFGGQSVKLDIYPAGTDLSGVIATARAYKVGLVTGGNWSVGTRGPTAPIIAKVGGHA